MYNHSPRQLTWQVLFLIIIPEKEASGLRLFSRLNGVQKVGGSNPPAPTIASTKAFSGTLSLKFITRRYNLDICLPSYLISTSLLRNDIAAYSELN